MDLYFTITKTTHFKNKNTKIGNEDSPEKQEHWFWVSQSQKILGETLNEYIYDVYKTTREEVSDISFG